MKILLNNPLMYVYINPNKLHHLNDPLPEEKVLTRTLMRVPSIIWDSFSFKHNFHY